MNLQFSTFNNAVNYVGQEFSPLWSGLTNGIESAASWRSTNSQATAAQHAQFGNQDRGDQDRYVAGTGLFVMPDRKARARKPKREMTHCRLRKRLSAATLRGQTVSER